VHNISHTRHAQLLDHLVGGGEQRRHCKAEHPGCGMVDQVNFGRLQDR
jgi:hypothetical protein